MKYTVYTRCLQQLYYSLIFSYTRRVNSANVLQRKWPLASVYHVIKYAGGDRTYFCQYLCCAMRDKKWESPLLREYGKERGGTRTVKRRIKLLYSHWNKCHELVTAPRSVPHALAHTLMCSLFGNANLTYCINSSFSLLLRLHRVIYADALCRPLYPVIATFV